MALHNSLPVVPVLWEILKFFEIFCKFNLWPPQQYKNQPQRAGRSQPIRQGKLELNFQSLNYYPNLKWTKFNWGLNPAPINFYVITTPLSPNKIRARLKRFQTRDNRDSSVFKHETTATWNKSSLESRKTEKSASHKIYATVSYPKTAS